jgi:hypothetical protein
MTTPRRSWPCGRWWLGYWMWSSSTSANFRMPDARSGQRTESTTCIAKHCGFKWSYLRTLTLMGYSPPVTVGMADPPRIHTRARRLGVGRFRTVWYHHYDPDYGVWPSLAAVQTIDRGTGFGVFAR